jgi:hypothetical protein
MNKRQRKKLFNKIYARLIPSHKHYKPLLYDTRNWKTIPGSVICDTLKQVMEEKADKIIDQVRTMATFALYGPSNPPE